MAKTEKKKVERTRAQGTAGENRDAAIRAQAITDTIRALMELDQRGMDRLADNGNRRRLASMLKVPYFHIVLAIDDDGISETDVNAWRLWQEDPSPWSGARTPKREG